MPATKSLTLKQRRFVEFYCGAAKGNATEAARQAGYKGSDNTLRAVGAENLSKPSIQAAIKELSDRESHKRILSLEEIQGLLTEWSLDPDHDIKARIKALDQLAKLQGGYLQRHEVSHKTPSAEDLASLLGLSPLKPGEK